MKKLNILFIVIIIIFMTGCNNQTSVIKIENAYPMSSSILIDLKGEVEFPGLYEVSTGTKMFDLINLAGGFTKYADKNKVNLVTEFDENTMVIIPKIQTSQNNETSSIINLNYATLDELSSLDGIGIGKAQAIISYREQVGYFKHIDELLNVSGIGESLYEKVKNSICV